MITVGPEDLLLALAWLGTEGESELSATLEALRVRVDQPLATITLAEQLGFVSVKGAQGQCWLEPTPPAQPPGKSGLKGLSYDLPQHPL